MMLTTSVADHSAFYQLFIVSGIMVAFWINYGCLLHLEAPAVYIVPLALQAVPAMYACVEPMDMTRRPADGPKQSSHCGNAFVAGEVDGHCIGATKPMPNLY